MIELIDLDTGDTMEMPVNKVNHPAAGLQFSGEPTERALRARDAHFAVQHWMDKCVKYPAEVPMNVDLDVVTSLDTLETILEALSYMAEERR
jgi:hypothetical protein